MLHVVEPVRGTHRNGDRQGCAISQAACDDEFASERMNALLDPHQSKRICLSSIAWLKPFPVVLYLHQKAALALAKSYLDFGGMGMPDNIGQRLLQNPKYCRGLIRIQSELSFRGDSHQFADDPVSALKLL